MEYDNEFMSLRRTKFVSRLRPSTLMLIEHYSKFYGVESDQLIDSAISNFVSKDDKFVRFLIDTGKKSTANG